MATVTSQLIVRLIDGVTGPARAAAQSLQSLGRAANMTAAVGVAGQYQRSVAGMANAAAQLRDNTAKAAAMSGPMAVGLGYAAKLAFDFEKAGNFLEALGDASAEQRAEFERFANTLNEKYPQSLGEIIRTGNELLKAGLNYSQMMGAIDQTLATAILGDMKPSEVATMISAALNAFQLPKETTEQAIASTQKVTDRMTYAAVKSTASLSDMGEMFKYVGAAAAATGNSIDDVTAMAMAFSANKINGSDAGVALRSAITRLATGGTKDGRAAMERAGLNLSSYLQGKTKITPDRVASGLLAGGIDITPIRGQVEALMQDPALMNAPIKLAAKITQLIQENITKFGSAIDASTLAENVQESIISAGSKVDLMRFFEDLKSKLAAGALSMGDIAKILEGRHFSRYQALLQADLAKLREQIQKDSEGYTQSRYKIVLKGIVGAFYELTAAIEGLSVAFGRAVFPEVAAGLKSIADSAKRLSETNPGVLKVIAAFAGLLVVLGPIGLLMGGVVASIGMFAAALKLAGAAAIAATAGLALFVKSLVAGAIVGGTAAVAVALASLRGALLALLIAIKAGGIGAALAMLGGALLSLLNPMRLVTAAAIVLRGALMLTGVGAVMAAIAGAFLFLKNNIGGIAEGAKAFGEAFMAALGPARPMAEGLVAAVKSLWEKFSALFGAIDPAKWKAWGAAAGTAVGSVVSYLSGLPAQIMQLGTDVTAWGRKIGRQILDGIKQAANDIIAYVTGLGARIGAAISGAVGGALSRLRGLSGGAKPSPAAPAPGRAAGGPISRGASYWVGERGPELITAGRSAYVNRAGATPGAAGGITVSPVFHMTFNGKADSEDVVEKIRRVMRDEVRETFRGVFSDTSMRFA